MDVGWKQSHESITVRIVSCEAPEAITDAAWIAALAGRTARASASPFDGLRASRACRGTRPGKHPLREGADGPASARPLPVTRAGRIGGPSERRDRRQQ